MALENWTVESVPRGVISEFVESHHYSGSINGVISDYCFALRSPDGRLCGAAIFGRMAMANQWKPFGASPDEVTELRRLCCIDDTPKNTESFFVGACLRWLKKNTNLRTVVSYSDLQYGHFGGIYRASNFEFLGFKKGARVINFNGRQYHDKAIRTYYKGTLKPFALRLKEALRTGEATYSETLGKNTFVYRLKKSG